MVAWRLERAESSQLAKELIAEAYRKQGVRPEQLTIHADRGTSMTSKFESFTILTRTVSISLRQPVSVDFSGEEDGPPDIVRVTLSLNVTIDRDRFTKNVRFTIYPKTQTLVAEDFRSSKGASVKEIKGRSTTVANLVAASIYWSRRTQQELESHMNKMQANADEGLKRDIYCALVSKCCKPNVSFMLPKACGGDLEVAFEVVESTIGMLECAGYNVDEANEKLSRAYELCGAEQPRYDRVWHCLSQAAREARIRSRDDDKDKNKDKDKENDGD